MKQYQVYKNTDDICDFFLRGNQDKPGTLGNWEILKNCEILIFPSPLVTFSFFLIHSQDSISRSHIKRSFLNMVWKVNDFLGSRNP